MLKKINGAKILHGIMDIDVVCGAAFRFFFFNFFHFRQNITICKGKNDDSVVTIQLRLNGNSNLAVDLNCN